MVLLKLSCLLHPQAGYIWKFVRPLSLQRKRHGEIAFARERSATCECRCFPAKAIQDTIIYIFSMQTIHTLRMCTA